MQRVANSIVDQFEGQRFARLSSPPSMRDAYAKVVARAIARWGNPYQQAIEAPAGFEISDASATARPARVLRRQIQPTKKAIGQLVSSTKNTDASHALLRCRTFVAGVARPTLAEMFRRYGSASIEPALFQAEHVGVRINIAMPSGERDTVVIDPHGDSNMLTGMFVDSLPGLEVKIGDTWVPVSGEFGDTLWFNTIPAARILDDALEATIHRVVIGITDAHRVTLPLSVAPNPDLALPTWASEGNDGTYRGLFNQLREARREQMASAGLQLTPRNF